MATRGASSQKKGIGNVLSRARKRLTPQRRTDTDIPLDVLNRTYTPKQTSVKASFRTDGDERQRDQEFADGYASESWGDEDHFTNKSGDPRIGTRHRKYEPKE